jgi:transposase-like protein
VPEETKQSASASIDLTTAVRRLPRCPQCGWRDVRLSYTRNTLDLILGMFSVRRFKCRSCGWYFRRWHRAELNTDN